MQMDIGTGRNASPAKGQAKQKQDDRIRWAVIGERLRVNNDYRLHVEKNWEMKLFSRLEPGSILEFVNLFL